MKKRLIGLLLCLVMVLGLLPATAFATETKYDLWLGETQVTGSNQNDILGNGTASFLPTTDDAPAKLMLNNYNGGNILSGFALDIVLTGTNTVMVDAQTEVHGINIYGSCTLSGSGSLRVQTDNTAGNGICIRSGDLTVAMRGDLDVRSKLSGLVCTNKSLLLSGSGNVTVHSGTIGLSAIYGSITISGSGTVDVDSEASWALVALRQLAISDLLEIATPENGFVVLRDFYSVFASKEALENGMAANHVVITPKEGAPISFVDVPKGSYYEDAVSWAVENEITTGTDATHFEPEASCTRAQAVTFLWRAAGCPAPSSAKMPFTDVKAGSYYYDAVLWAVEKGVTNGTTDTTFSPEATCTRAQIVTFLWRSQNSPVAGSSNPFTDVKPAAYYADAVLWAVKENVTKGMTDTSFAPEDNCTRAQIVTFIYRALAK